MPPDDTFGLTNTRVEAGAKLQTMLASTLSPQTGTPLIGSAEIALLSSPVELSRAMDLGTALQRLSKAADSGTATARELQKVLDVMLPAQSLLPPVARAMPELVSQVRRGKVDKATQMLQAARMTTRLQDQQAFFFQATNPTDLQLPIAAATPTIVIVFEVISVIATLIGLGLAIKEIAESIEGSPDTECWDIWKGEHNFDSANVQIKKFGCDSTIKDVDDGVVIIIDEIPKECTITITGNDGTIRVKDNKGTLVIEDNDDGILIDNNNGTVDINGNDDTIVIDNNNDGAEVRVDGNSDSIGVTTNNGTTTVNGNDDTVSVNENGQSGSIDVNGNNDTVNVKENDGKLDVDGNSGGTLDDADVNVIDNNNGVINANNNDGNINVGVDSNGSQGTINKGNNPGDIQKL